MDDGAKKAVSDNPTDVGPQIRRLLSARVSRRQILKASLIGMGGLAAAGGLARLESLAAAAPGRGRWRQIGLKIAPGLRTGAAVANDGGRRVLVLFSGGAEADTWTWDGLTWTRQNPPLSPPARVGASFAYHPPTKTAMLYGGMNPKGDFLEDTWLWNGRTWIAASGTGPRARSRASMAFDPARGNVVMFGGFNGGLLGDTWIWDGKSWRALSSSSSPPPVGAGFAYSAAAGKLITCGGTRFQGAMGGSQETWGWDGSNWSEVSFGSSPPARKNAAMAADPEGRLILLFGGLNDRGLLGDTWRLTSVWSQDTQTPAPSPRIDTSLVPDPSSNSFLLFGGADRGKLMGDIWA